METEVLGVKIDDLSLNEALARIEQWIHSGGKHYVSPKAKGKVPAKRGFYVSPKAKGKVPAKRGFYIVTPNPEIIVAAQQDEDLKKILNNADLSIPDGVGLKFSGSVKNTVAGVDLMEKIISLSAEKGFTVGLLGGQEGVANRLAECLKRQYQNISVTFAQSGGKVNVDGKIDAEKSLKIPPSDILFVAFGPPKQEKWIANNRNIVPVNVMMGVGGSFDELSGKVPRCPKWIQMMGLKWLFRLMLEPWRIKRQLALVRYVWLLTQSKFRR